MSKGRKNYAAIITTRQKDGKVRISGGATRPKKTTVRAFLDEIPPRLRPTIRSFTTDMWESYLNAVEEYSAEHDDSQPVSLFTASMLPRNTVMTFTACVSRR